MGMTPALSNEILNAVWDLPLGSSTDKLVLVALADYANAQGRCWPSMDTLSRRTELTPRTVQKAVARLKSLGWVEVIHTSGHSNVFVIHTPVFRTGTPVPGSPPPPSQGRGTPVPRSPITLRDPPFEPSRIRRAERPLETVADREESGVVLRMLRKGVEDRRS